MEEEKLSVRKGSLRRCCENGRKRRNDYSNFEDNW